MGIPNSFSNVPLPLIGRASHTGGIPEEDIRTALGIRGNGEWGKIWLVDELTTSNNSDNFNLVTFFHLSL
jgi:hypothetical protein